MGDTLSLQLLRCPNILLVAYCPTQVHRSSMHLPDPTMPQISLVILLVHPLPQLQPNRLSSFLHQSKTNNLGLINPLLSPQMFNAMSFSDLGNVGWYIDTRATSHLHSNAIILSSIFGNNKFPNSICSCN